MLAFTSMVFSGMAIYSYSPLIKVTLLAIAWYLMSVAALMFISSLIEKDTVTPKVQPTPTPRKRKSMPGEVKIPIRDSNGRFVKWHAPTNPKRK